MKREIVKVIMGQFPVVKSESPQMKGTRGQPTERSRSLSTLAEPSDAPGREQLPPEGPRAEMDGRPRAPALRRAGGPLGSEAAPGLWGI